MEDVGSEDNVDDVDEETRLTTLLGPDLPQLPPHMDAWLAERRSRYTKARRDAAAENLRQREQDRERTTPQTKDALAEHNSGNDNLDSDVLFRVENIEPFRHIDAKAEILSAEGEENENFQDGTEVKGKELMKMTRPASDPNFETNEFLTSQRRHTIKEAFAHDYFDRFFVTERELGRGSRGVVFLVKYVLDGVELGHFACKRVPIGNDTAWLEKVLIESKLLQGVSHPNLVSYRHFWLEYVKLNRFSPTVPCAYILQQYCNSGDLLHYISPPEVQSTNEQLEKQKQIKSRRVLLRALNFEEIYLFFKDMTSGLSYLHASHYLHRDLKPSNILLTREHNNLHCLINDFGEAQSENEVRHATGSTGTICYCAPEVLIRDQFGRYGNFTTKSDIFSLGMILYFMCFESLPYASAYHLQEEFEDIDLLRTEITSWPGFQDGAEERRIRPDLPNQIFSLMKRLLAINPGDRPNAKDILGIIGTGEWELMDVQLDTSTA